VLQHVAARAATCCNDTLQHTATHCNTLPHTATHFNTLQHTVNKTLSNSLLLRTRITAFYKRVLCRIKKVDPSDLFVSDIKIRPVGIFEFDTKGVLYQERVKNGRVSDSKASLPPLEWLPFPPLVAAVLITPKGAESPGSGRIGVIGVLVIFSI